MSASGSCLRPVAEQPNPLPMTSQSDSLPVMEIVGRLEQLAAADADVNLRDVIEAFGSTAFVPILMVPALIVFSPLSGIPFLPTFFGLIIGLIALQMTVGRRRLWLPGWLMGREVSSDRLTKALQWLKPSAAWLDRKAKRRLTLLTAQPLVLIPRIACIVCGLAMPFLELVPFSSSFLAAAVLCFSVSFLARDGVFVVLGGVFMAMALGVLVLIYGGAVLAFLPLV